MISSGQKSDYIMFNALKTFVLADKELFTMPRFLTYTANG